MSVIALRLPNGSVGVEQLDSGFQKDTPSLSRNQNQRGVHLCALCYQVSICGIQFLVIQRLPGFSNSRSSTAMQRQDTREAAEEALVLREGIHERIGILLWLTQKKKKFPLL